VENRLGISVAYGLITPARKILTPAHTSPTRQRGRFGRALAGAF
jgi:hypothetical protein